ncbi:hypothetical protein QAD02_014375 [Eretmocerus hayati]|uniref:Uncharacterized protein n=1 Tax=Eretmocerus hayati TaxID=131215 RepID=A0ACC2P660_9HYME|nr:hypothetical protein QAD02_014375 [Eretmocerus hayati]
MNKVVVRALCTSKPLSYVKPVNLKNKKHSSQQWLVRQLKDPYIEKAKQHNYRCRSAFKLLEIHEKFGILHPGMHVVDCGAAPGSWTQVATRLTNANGRILDEPHGKVIAIDKLPIHPVEGASILGNLDFTTERAQDTLFKCLDGSFVDLVMSDMAPNATGVKDMDHENIIKLAYAVLKFALTVTCHEGSLIIKLWDGSKAPQLEADIAKYFKSVKIVRPQATRDESSEKFILARNFKGLKAGTARR